MPDQEFDVFLCHNSEDKPAVIEIARQLQGQNIKPWLDNWEMRPGFDWQDILEQQIEQIQSAAIFVGSSGLGPWQSKELKAFLRELNNQCPIIPILLPGAPKKPKLPIFLRGNIWVDFRLEDPNPLKQLIWGINGTKPSFQPTDDSKIISNRIRKNTSVTYKDLELPVKKGQEQLTKRKNLEWAGDWFVNVGEGGTRTWDDCVKYGFLSAGQGAVFSKALKRLDVGSTVYAYMGGLGYVGLGKVTQKAVPIKDFTVGQEKTPLLNMDLKAEHPDANSDNLELSEWIVGIKWLNTFPKDQAQRFVGAFANQNVVCKLKQEQTLEFLRKKFGWAGDWFVNVGEGSGHRSWKDCLRYGFISAGQDPRLTAAMRKLEVGHTLYAYLGGAGYVGFGEIVEEAVPIKSFTVEPGNTPLLSMDLKAKGLDSNVENLELSEWVARIKWLKTYTREEARWFTGAFVHRGTLCKLGQRKTLDFLHTEFGKIDALGE